MPPESPARLQRPALLVNPIPAPLQVRRQHGHRITIPLSNRPRPLNRLSLQNLQKRQNLRKLPNRRSRRWALCQALLPCPLFLLYPQSPPCQEYPQFRPFLQCLLYPAMN